MTSQHTDLLRRGPRRASAAAAATIVASLAGLALWSAWPVLSPAHPVEVVQAVHDVSGVQAPAAASDARDATQTAGGNERGSVTVQAAGWLEAYPYYTAVPALTDGIIESIHVLEGDAVEANQVVATLIDDDRAIALRGAEAALAAASARLEHAQAELVAAEAHWAEPIALTRALETSTAASREAEAELEQLPFLIEAARATLVRLEEERDRLEASSARQATNELELVIAQQRAAAQRAEVSALQARTQILEARLGRLEAERVAAQRELDLRIEDRRRVAAAKAAVATAEAEVLRLTAARDDAALALERTQVRSPVAGRVQFRLKLPGDKVARQIDAPHSAHVLHVYDPEQLQVRVDVALAEASHVFIGQRCEVVVEALPGQTFEGIVVRETHEADIQKNTLQFKVRVVDPDPMLRPEMLTRVKFLPGRASSNAQAQAASASSVAGVSGPVVLVPASAIDASDAGQPVIWRVTERSGRRGIARPVPVRVLEQHDAWTSISAEVPSGALLVTAPSGLNDGQRVRFSLEAQPGERS